MNVLKTVAVVACLSLSKLPLCQQESAPGKIEFGSGQCRADAQKWTVDSSAVTVATLHDFAAIMVNGQLRFLFHISRHVTHGELVTRAHEMAICKREDADFEKQFGTYSWMEQAYSDEETFRYMYFINKHHLDEQFVKEDAEDFK